MIIAGIDEEWRPVPGARHDVSSRGRVRQHLNATHPERRQIAIRKLTRDKDGYLFLRISGTRWLVHRLVYSVFCGCLVDGLVVCHLDGNRSNNTPENLLQADQRTNIGHKLQHGTHQFGQRHPKALYSDDEVSIIKKAISNAPRGPTGRLRRGSIVAIASEHHVGLHLVSDLSRNRSWRRI